MNKNLQQLLLLIVLAGVFVFLGWRQTTGQKHPAIPANFPLVNREEAPESEEVVALKEIVYRVVERDPLLSPLETDSISVTQTEEEVAPPQMEVHGVVWGGNRPMCVIDGKVLQVGDTIHEARILEIKKEGVVFMFSGKIFTAVPRGPLNPINSAGSEK